MTEEPTDPLGPLSTTPVPLVGADQVRARGRQRARRAQALLAGTGVVLVAALGGGVALLVDGPGEQSLVVPGTPSAAGPTATSDPTRTPDPCATMTRPSGVTCRVGPDGGAIVEQVPPEPTDLQPTLIASPTPGSTATLPASTLVTVSSLESAFPASGGAAWIRNASSRTSQPWDIEPCGAPVGRPSASFVSGDYRQEAPGGRAVPEGPGVRDEVSRLASPAEAAAAVQAFRAAVASCPIATYSTTYGGQTSPTQVSYKHEVVSEDPYVFARFGAVGGGAFYPFPVYYGAIAVDDLVAVWSYGVGEGTDVAGAVTVAGLVQDGLCRTAGSC